MSGRKRDPLRRTYRPVVEGLETLQLLANALPAFADVLPGDEPLQAYPIAPAAFSGDAWDAALVRSRVSDLLSSDVASDPSDILSGLEQLDRYLGRAWYRAGIDVQRHDDCTQAVYAGLLQQLGRDRFDATLAEIGRSDIREVLSRESIEGPDFFRIVDAVKKRAQRERVHQPIDRIDVAESSNYSPDEYDRRSALRDAIRQSLSPREASLIQATLEGRTPAEIAQNWGVAPKTVSNEKARALQKLREVLTAVPAD